MRENLFRGKPTERFKDFLVLRKEFCENGFVYGSLVVSNNRYYICVSGICSSRSIVNNGITTMVEVIPETVGQYIGGIPDKNGKKIFEGDIVGFDGELCYEVYYIIFVDGCFRIAQNGRYSYTLHNLHSSLEVIGNIHDNPELLKGGVE